MLRRIVAGTSFSVLLLWLMVPVAGRGPGPSLYPAPGVPVYLPVIRTDADAVVAPEPIVTPLQECEPSYPTLCLPIGLLDEEFDCESIPDRDFDVLPPDPYSLDDDGDGVGCES